jgi:hypothetical protein
MSKLRKSYEFLDYINTPLTKEGIDVIYRSNKIIYEKSELYSDFIQSLIDLIYISYLGDDMMNIDRRIEHYNWCWNKTVDNYKKENKDFSDNKLVYEYFQLLLIETFYMIEDKNSKPDLIPNIKKMWEYVFDYRITKPKLDIDTFTEVYKLFSKTLNKL